jgi:predicted nucleotidyltransferase component of viral defense system
MATLIQVLQNNLSDKAHLPNNVQRIVLKEVLQAHVLDYLYNHAAYRLLNFYGGTCLHVVYGLNRLSEDIDLDNRSAVDVTPLADDLEQHFNNMQPEANISARIQRGESNVLRITLRFPVLFILGLSAHQNENLHLKVEISHHPQVAEIQHTPVLYYSRAFVPAHFSLETMMAGKILACLERSFRVGQQKTIKGRDFYDLLWFMQQQIQPLEEKLAQDGEQPYSIQTAMQALSDKVNTISRRDLAQDLLPLFENRTFIEAWLDAFHENFTRFSEPYFSK